MMRSVLHWGFIYLLPCGCILCFTLLISLLHQSDVLSVSAVALPSTLYWVPNHRSFRWHCPSLAADSKTRLAFWGRSWLRASAMTCEFKTILQVQMQLSLTTGRTRHNKLTKKDICFLNRKKHVSVNTKPVPVLRLITNACIGVYIIRYAHIFFTSKSVIGVERIFTSGLYSNKSWSPVRKSSFWNNCMFSHRLST